MRGLSLSGPSLVFLRISVAFGHFCRFCHLCRARLFRSGQEWRPPIQWPDLARFGPIYALAKRWNGGRGVNLALRSPVRGGPPGPGCGLGWLRHEWPGVTKLLIQLHLVAFRCIPYRLRGAGMRGSRLRGNDGGLGGEISILWLNLALLAPFTPSGEAGNEATVASFGTTLTPTHCASVALDVARVASLGVARSGETFKTVSFSLIRSHFISSEPSSALPPGGDFCVTAPGGRSSSHPPARYACGGHPHTPGSGASPLCTPPFEGLREASL